jgi:hypothetical protein
MEFNTQLTVRHANQRDFLQYLRSISHPYADDFNSENPPEKRMKRANEIEAQIKEHGNVLPFLAVTTAIFLGLAAVGMPGVPWWCIFISIGLLIYSERGPGRQKLSAEQMKKEVAHLRASIAVDSYHEEFVWFYKSLHTTFRFIFHLDSYDAGLEAVKNRITHDIEPIFHQFTEQQTDYFDQNDLHPGNCKWDPNQVECLFLPAFILTTHDFNITLFRYRLMITPPAKPPAIQIKKLEPDDDVPISE